MEKLMLYKYRGIKELRYFVDIILNQRLYASSYFDLNDPMEGHYLYSKGELDSEVRSLIKGNKEKTKICSLSKTHNNELLWAHYAEGHRGVAIGVTINESKHKIIPVIYGDLPQISNLSLHHLTAQEILSHKLEVWRYEEEMRVFTDNKLYVDVKIEEVILGRGMSNQDKSFIKKLIENINININIKNATNNYV